MLARWLQGTGGHNVVVSSLSVAPPMSQLNNIRLEGGFVRFSVLPGPVARAVTTTHFSRTLWRELQQLPWPNQIRFLQVIQLHDILNHLFDLIRNSFSASRICTLSRRLRRRCGRGLRARPRHCGNPGVSRLERENPTTLCAVRPTAIADTLLIFSLPFFDS